jgi:DNA-binding NarL/FixJ family response regulator
VKVLLADDDAHVRSALRLLLEDEPGMAIVGESVSADGLLDQVAAAQPAVVLLDWELPGLHADGLLDGLRALQPAPYLVALSGRPEAHDEALRAGIPNFVCKGDAPDVLLAAVRALTAVLS